MKPRKLITQEYLKELFNYDSETGRLSWRINKYRVTKGQEAGTANAKGYRIVCINQRNYRVSSIVWMMVYGEWVFGLDHANTVKNDNRLINLRKATASQQQQNQK